MRPFRNDLLQLKEGVRVRVGNQNAETLIKGIVLCGTADQPAKAKFLNFKAFNSINGCCKCKIETMYIRRGLRVYPFRRGLQMRTEAETLLHAQEAVNLPPRNGERQAVCGVKGPTELSLFVHQYIRSTCVDVMHCVFLGQFKAQLHLWFDTKHHEENFSLTDYIRLMNQRLSEICPPSFVKRLPRTLKDLKYLKAYELKLLLFYYSVPLLHDIMPDLYFNHHLLLVHGIYLLCQSSISEEMLQLSTELLTEYVSQYGNLYGIEHMTSNVHNLLHLPQTVRDYGPLFVSSCSAFEDLNGKLKQLVNGTRYAELQICTSVSMLFKLRDLRENIMDGEVSQFCKRLTDKNQKLNRTRISPRMWIVGKYRKLRPLPMIVQEAIQASNVQGTQFFEFNRLLKYCVIFGSQSYRRAQRTASYCVKYLNDGVEKLGFVQSYVRVTNCYCEHFCLNCDPKFYAIITNCITAVNFTSWPGAALNFIHTHNGQEERAIAVDVEHLQSVCFLIKVRDKNTTHIIETVNMVEPE